MTLDTRLKSPEEKLALLLEFGLIVIDAAGGDTTTDAQAAAAQKVVPVVDETGFVADDLVIIGRGNTLEVGQVASVQAGVSITMKNELKFTHASGEDVKEGKRIDLGDVQEDGVSEELTLGVNVHRAGTKHGPWDATPGDHESEIVAQILNATLDNMGRALGLDVDGSDGGGLGTAAEPWYLDADPERVIRALKDSAEMARGRIPAVYVLGEYQHSGEQFELQYWSCLPAGGDYGMTFVKGTPAVVQFRFFYFSNARRLRWAP